MTSQEAIQAHYDVGNEFYELWLDPTLCYSCALWEESEPDSQLEVAQRRKIAHHIAAARARGASRVLDVGCGWGAVLRTLVEEAGVGHAVGLTLSREQAEHIWSWQHPALEVRLEHWADHQPALPYESIISVGAFEHFAKPDWAEAEKEAAYRHFFTCCHGWLQPGGRLSLQTIAYGNSDPGRAKSVPEHRFLLREVFPEAELPTLENILRATEGLFELVALRNDREDYERTCKVWAQRLATRRAEAVALVGQEKVTRYLRYLKTSMALFHYGRIGLLRLTLQRVEEERV